MTYPAPYGTLPIGAVPAYVLAEPVGENILLLSGFDSDLATITASSEVSAFPASNLQTIQPSKVWRSTSTTAYLVLAFPVPMAATALAMVAHNFSGRGIVRIRAAATLEGLTSAPAVDTGWQSVWPASGKPTAKDFGIALSLVRWANRAAYVFWRVDLCDPAPSLAWLDVGRLVLGVPWQPSVNVDIAGGIGLKSADVQLTSDWGLTFTAPRLRPRTFQLKSSDSNQREAFDGILELMRVCGMAGDLICIIDPGATSGFYRKAMQGAFTNASPGFSPIPGWDQDGNLWTYEIDLIEFVKG